MQVTIVVQPGEGDWVVAHCLEIPEAIRKGKTIQEAKDNVIDAIKQLFEGRREHYLSHFYLEHSTLRVNL